MNVFSDKSDAMSTENPTDNADFGQRLSAFRRARGLTQTQLAKELHVTRSYLSEVEHGQPCSGKLVSRFEEFSGRNGELSDFQRRVNNPIRRAREGAGLTIRELSRRTKYSIGVLQALEEGRPGVLSERMSEALKLVLPELDVEMLLRNDENPRVIGLELATMGTKPDIGLPPGMRARFVPLISWAQAGESGGNFEDIYDYEAYLVFDPKDPKTTAIRIKGDSMSPQVPDGSIAVVYPSYPPVNGDWVVAKGKDGAQFFKILTVVRPGMFRFSSYNPSYEPFERTAEEMEWIYLVDSISMKSPNRH